jgi:hypothetical protein
VALDVARRVAIIDVAVVGGMSLVYVALEALDVPKRWSFVAVGVALGIYAIFLVRRRTHSLHAMGFRTDNLVAGLIPVGIWTLVAGTGLVTWAVLRGRAVWGQEVLVLLALYPAWAVVQQLGFQGLLHRGLMVLVPSPALQVLGAAGAFACVHVGNAPLLALTFITGLIWSVLYRRWPNLWLLAGSHTVLAALAYPLVLGDVPLSRL